MNYKKIGIYLLLLLLLSALVMAAQTSTAGGGDLDILYPKQLSFRSGEDITIHVTALDNGAALVGDNQTNCTLYFYNTQDQLTSTNNMTYSEPDWSTTINSSEYENDGEYRYNIICSGIHSGFVSDRILITTSGHSVSDNRYLSIMVLAVITSAIFVYMAFSLQPEHFILKVLLYFFSIFCLIIAPTAIINGAAAAAMNLNKTVMWFFRLFVTYFSVYIAYHYFMKSETMMKKFNVKRGDQG